MIFKSKIALSLIIVCCFTSCNKKTLATDEINSYDLYDLSDIRERGVLRVATLESAFSYYVNGDGEKCGLDYDLVSDFADYLDLDLELIVADNSDDLIKKIELGQADIAAYKLDITDNKSHKLCFADNKERKQCVLVQKRGRERLTDITEFSDKEIWAVKNQDPSRALINRNEEIGGLINIKYPLDTISEEELIRWVSKGRISYCVASSDMANLLVRQLGNIECGLTIGETRPYAWAVKKGRDSLILELNNWLNRIEDSKSYKKLLSKYIYDENYFCQTDLIQQSNISPFDKWFKKYADEIGWDWRMLASLAWNESRFDLYAKSSTGAEGLMQMMPRTARSVGLKENEIHDPQKIIAAGVEYLKILDTKFREVEDNEERIKFMLAGYNAGPGHIKDAMALARKYGDNPYKWEDNVEYWLMKKREKTYYKDSVCHHGFFRAGHTLRYVNDVYETYNGYVSNKK